MTNLTWDSITSTTISRCLELYPRVIERIYKQKLKPAKIEAAHADDRWRYDELPEVVRVRGADRLDKAALARLVQWKITHGQNRPFLPGMVKKNAEDLVLACVKEAFARLSDLPQVSSKPSGSSSKPAALSTALDAVCKLTGVGPATGTLVLSIAHEGVPFFEDELYEWCFPEYGKLKYTLKEYLTLYVRVRDVLERTSKKAADIEQTAFVLKHMEVLEQGEKDQIFHAESAEQTQVQLPDAGAGLTHETSDTQQEDEGKTSVTAPKGGKAQQVTKRKSDLVKTENDSGEARRSKRIRS